MRIHQTGRRLTVIAVVGCEAEYDRGECPVKENIRPRSKGYFHYWFRDYSGNILMADIRGMPFHPFPGQVIDATYEVSGSAERTFLDRHFSGGEAIDVVRKVPVGNCRIEVVHLLGYLGEVEYG